EVGRHRRPRERDGRALTKLATGAGLQVDVFRAEQTVRPDGGREVRMQLAGVARVDDEVDQGITVLELDAVHRPDLGTAQLHPGARIHLAVGTGLQLDTQRVAEGEREGDEN